MLARVTFASRLCLRHFAARPWLSCLVVVSLGLGIGANAAVATFANSIFIRSLPYRSADQLVYVWRTAKNRPSILTGFFDDSVLQRQLLTPAMVREWRGLDAIFEDIAAIQSWQTGASALIDLIDAASVERMRGAMVTPNLLSVLGIAPVLGRTFNDADTDVVLISHQVWQRRYGGNPGVIGRDLTLGLGRDRQPRSYRVIGVLPRRFDLSYPEPTDLLVPLRWSHVETESQNVLVYQAVARLRRGVSADVAERVLQGTLFKDAEGAMTVWLEPVQENAVSPVRATVKLIGAMSIMTLAIACLNTATVFVAVIAGRKHEIAVRYALGSTRWRIVGGFLIEMAVLAFVAGVLALAAVSWLIPLLRSILPLSMPRIAEIEVDSTTLLVVVATAVVGVILAGMIPAVIASRNSDLSLLTNHLSATEPTGPKARLVLVVLQVALVWVLLGGSGLLLRSYWNLADIDAGFEPRHISTVELRLLHPAYRDQTRRSAFENELLAEVKALPGITHATIASAIPFRGLDPIRQIPVPGTSQRILAYERYVDPDYFRIMGISVIRGRHSSNLNDDNNASEVVISESLAHALYRDDAIGKPLGSGEATIVGIVSDVRSRTLASEAMPAIYAPRSRARSTMLCLILSTDQMIANLSAPVTRIVRKLDPNQPIQRFTTLEQVIAESIADRRLYAFTASAFGMLMLSISAIGVAGVVSLAITARRRELAIRAAIGASLREQVLSVIGQILIATVIGIGFGIAITQWAGQAAQHFLYGVQASDLVVNVGTVALILMAGATAAIIPLRWLPNVDIASVLKRH